MAQGPTGQGLITIIGMGIYNAVAPTLQNGQSYQLSLDVNGNVMASLATAIAGEDTTNSVLGTIQKPVVSSSYSPARFTNFGAATKANVKNSTGQILSVIVTNANAAVRYLQIHNKASAPVGGDTPVLSIPIPIGAGSSIPPLILDQDFFSQNGEYLSTGVSWAISTSIATFTDSASAADHSINGHYI